MSPLRCAEPRSFVLRLLRNVPRGVMPVIAVCWLLAMGINFGSRHYFPHRLQEDITFLPKNEIVDFLSLDHRGFAADLLFIKVVLHSGSLIWKPRSFTFRSEWSYRLIDLVTELDPRYYDAYLFAGMGLVHADADVERARNILDKGMRVFPASWELPFWAGFNYYLYRADDLTAGDYLWQAAHKPGAPTTFLGILVSTVTRAGIYERGIWALQGLMRTTHNTKVLQVYKKRIGRLQNLITLRQAIERYVRQQGRYPVDLDQLVQAGVLATLPEDPMAKKYVWNTREHRLEVR